MCSVLRLLLLIGVLIGTPMLVPSAEASNAFKKKKGKRRYPPKKKGRGRCKGGQPLLELLICASGEAGEFDNNRKDFDILRDLLITSELDPSELDDVTFFAPDDRAFHRLAMDLEYEGGYDEEAIVAYLAVALEVLLEVFEIDLCLECLIQFILIYHVATENYSFDDLRDEIQFDTLLTSTLEDLGANEDAEGTRLESEKANGGRVRIRHGTDSDDLDNPKIHNRFQDLKVEEGRMHVIKNVLFF